MNVKLDPRWGPTDGQGLTRAAIRRNRRHSWWSIMAYEHDMVTAPEATHGRNEIACHLLPDIFSQPSKVTPVKDRVFPEELLLFWHQDVVPAKVRLPGLKHWTPVWVHARSNTAAKKILKSKMPEGSDIVVSG